MTMVRHFLNARVFGKNFSGREETYNRAGQRYFLLRFHPIQAEELRQDGWNVRETLSGMHILRVRIDPEYDTDLSRLDFHEFETAEVILEARPWDIAGRGEGHTAFLISITPNQ